MPLPEQEWVRRWAERDVVAAVSAARDVEQVGDEGAHAHARARANGTPRTHSRGF